MKLISLRNLFFFITLHWSCLAYSQVSQQTLIDQTLRINSGSQTRTYSFNFNRTPEQLTSNYQYSLVIQNADGQVHIVPTAQSCQNLGLFARLFCLAQRAINQVYNSTLRVRSADISLNGVQVVNSSNFNDQTNVVTIVLNNVSLQNILNITIKGPRNSFANVKVISQLTPNQDQQAPVLMADILSNAITNNPNVNISINDSSNVTTEVYRNSELLFSTNEKTL